MQDRGWRDEIMFWTGACFGAGVVWIIIMVLTA